MGEWLAMLVADWKDMLYHLHEEIIAVRVNVGLVG
jgi:hypothetical protein